jgi:hypothetical protein
VPPTLRLPPSSMGAEGYELGNPADWVPGALLATSPFQSAPEPLFMLRGLDIAVLWQAPNETKLPLRELTYGGRAHRCRSGSSRRCTHAQWPPGARASWAWMQHRVRRTQGRRSGSGCGGMATYTSAAR